MGRGIGLSRRAEMGIGTLIIFIALLLVAAIAAGVLIQTSGSLQEKALTTGDQAKGQIATNVRVVEVSATDGSDGSIDDFYQIIKLAPGSDAIKIAQTLFTMNSFDLTATLKYRGVNGTCVRSNSGYNTWNIESVTTTFSQTTPLALEEDYDDDGINDYIAVNGSGAIYLNFSSSADYASYNAICNETTNQTIQATLTIDTDEIATIVLDVICSNNEVYGGNSTINITPKNRGQGYFAVEYLQRGANPVAGNLQRGDVIKICFESPKSITEDEKIRINFIPKIGTPTLTEFITPEVVSTERVYLYP